MRHNMYSMENFEVDDATLDIMPERELIILLNNLSQVVYSKDYYQIFDYDNTEREELVNNYYIMIKRYNIINPVLEQVSTDIGSKRNFLDVWMEIWKKSVYGMDEIGEIYGLSVLSQLFRNTYIVRGGVKDDLRIHICLIAPTGSGKSEGNVLTGLFCQKCPAAGLTAIMPEEYSPATMIGTVNRNIINSNIAAKANDPSNPDWRDPIRLGALGTQNFLMFDEAENILKTTTRTEGMQRILQHAMNRYGSPTNVVSNDLVDGKVECSPNCNIIFTSFYLEEFKDTLLTRGLLQRMLVIYKDSKDVDRDRISNYIIDGLEEMDQGEDTDSVMQRVTDKQNEIVELYKELDSITASLMIRHTGTQNIFLMRGVKDQLKSQREELKSIIPAMSPFQHEQWEAMLSRIAPMFIKTSSIYAMADGREYITADDIKRAAKVINFSMQSVAFFMMSKISSKKTSDELQQTYDKMRRKHRQKKNSEEEWINIIIEMFGISTSKAKRLVDDLKQSDKLKQRTSTADGTTKLLELV